MAKPTLLQSLLGRPSQSYAFPRERQHYSSKGDLARALASSSSSPSSLERTEVAPPVTGVGRFQKGKGKASYARPKEDIPLPDSETSISSDSDDSADEAFYTPFSSPPTSMLVDPSIPFIPSDPSSSLPTDDKSSSSSASSSSSSTSHSVLSC